MRKLPVILFALLALWGCGSFHYGSIQSDFNQAVAADNASIDNPLLTPTAGYEEILIQLTPAEIAKLDAKLQPNAWMLRAVSAWRTGDLSSAKGAADAGLAIPPPAHSRDKVVLMSVYGFIAETEATAAWRSLPAEQRDRSLYDANKAKLALAWDKLSRAQAEISGDSPPSLASYVHYQKWRVAANWAGIIGGCETCTPQQRNEMREEAKADLGGKEPQEAADAERNQVKGQLRDLIRAQGGG